MRKCTAMPTPPNNILKLDPDHLRELDGVVLDADSFSRHAPNTEKEAVHPGSSGSFALPVSFSAPVSSGFWMTSQSGSGSAQFSPGGFGLELI